MPPRCALLLPLVLLCPNVPASPAGADWPVYLGDSGASHYSTLAQINRSNVGSLREAWVYRSGDARSGSTQVQCNALKVGRTVYATTAGLNLVALDAGTGRELWRFQPPEANGVNRGVVYWKNEYEERILFGSGRWLNAVDAKTGRPVVSFGDQGRIDLGLGLGRDVTGLSIQANTPGSVVGDLLIMGMRVGEGPGKAAPGHIRAYNVRTGELVWRFNTIPWPGEVGYETWPADAWQRVGGANVWAGFAVDRERGLVFCPVGSATFDFWGGDRHGDNLFTSCLVALDARTGKRVWHHQLVRHDLWDRDPPAPPTLLTVTRDGRRIDAVAQVTKQGFVYVFDRQTGESLFPLEEISVPPSDLEGEEAAPTQRVPLKPAPFARQLFTADLITDRTPQAQEAVRSRFAELKPHVRFLPPSQEGTLIYPGFDGGAEWGGAAADPEGVLYVNSNEMPWILTMIRIESGRSRGEQVYQQNCIGCHGPNREGNVAANVPSLMGVEKRLTEEQALEVITKGRNVMPAWQFLPLEQRRALVHYLFGNEDREGLPPPEDPAHQQDKVAADAPPPYTHTGYNRFLDPDGYPAVKPPWGTLNAIDLNTGDFRWRVPLGEFEPLSRAGIQKTGTENYGGPVVTAGGLVFIAATKDECIRAFDTATGDELWRAKLPAGGYATPTTFEVDGKQYLLIACGGGKMGTKSDDAYVAFALP
ncbi:PQQ-binding-like beta-propeller repeat protein [Nibricoccus sp. IMCC34717]|uniref:outer membrane protein assembly factor BamB family protein n=1 Tax=Nibricoccus sp. IMCC34717 TaxID=3034021 RepID=UPI00384D0741